MKSWIQAELIVREIENEATFNEYLEKFPVIGEWKKKPIHTLPKTHFQIQSTYIDSQTFNLSNSFCARQSLATTYIHEVPNLFFLYVGRKSP